MTTITSATPVVPASVATDAAWLVRSYSTADSTLLARAQRMAALKAAGMSGNAISAYLRATVKPAAGQTKAFTPSGKTVAQYLNTLATLPADATAAAFADALRTLQRDAAGSSRPVKPASEREETGPADAAQGSVLVTGITAERAHAMLVAIVQASRHFSESDRALVADSLVKAATVVRRPQPVRDGIRSVA